MKRLLILSLFSLMLAATAGRPGKDISWTDGKWIIPEDVQISRGVKTSFGTLYHFTPGTEWRYFSSLTREYQEHKFSCRCATCERRYGMVSLQSKFPEKLKKRRFLAINFQARDFPVEQKSSDVARIFDLTFSSNASPGKDHFAIDSAIPFFLGSPMWWHIRSDSEDIPKEKLPENYTEPSHDNVFFYNPRFEPLNITVLIDQQKSNTLYVLINSDQAFFEQSLIVWGKKPLRSIGISLQAGKRAGLTAIFDWEFTTPRFAGFDEESVRDKLIAGHTFQPYPPTGCSIRQNSSAISTLKRAKSDKNPDFIYSCAMQGLDDSDGNPFFHPPYAVDLLQKAVRQKHILATGQLGLCYLRGFGIKQNIPKGLDLLETAARHGHASSLAAVAAYRFLQRRFFPVFPEENWSMAPSVRFKNYHNHDVMALLQLVGTPVQMLVEGSPRNAVSATISTAVTKFIPKRLEPFTIKNPYGYVTGEIMYPPHLTYLNQEWLRQSAASGEPLAQYGLAAYRFSVNPEKLDQDDALLKMVESSISKGVRYAQLLRWKMLLLRKKKIAAEMNIQADFLFAEEPLYWLLKFAASHPDEPWCKVFVPYYFFARAKTCCAEDQTPLGKFHMAMLLLGYESSPLMRGAMHEFPGNRPDCLKAAQYLTEAAEGGVPEAQYWIGRWLLELPKSVPETFPWKKDVEKGKELLKAAINQGHAKARYILAEQEWKSNGDVSYALKLLEPLCEARIGQACLLKAKILITRHDDDAAMACARHAAEAGEPLGYSMLALSAPSPETQLELWKKFAALERKTRQTDLLDIYYPVHTRRLPVFLYEKIKDADPVPQRRSKSKKE